MGDLKFVTLFDFRKVHTPVAILVNCCRVGVTSWIFNRNGRTGLAFTGNYFVTSFNVINRWFSTFFFVNFLNRSGDGSWCLTVFGLGDLKFVTLFDFRKVHTPVAILVNCCRVGVTSWIFNRNGRTGLTFTGNYFVTSFDVLNRWLSTFLFLIGFLNRDGELITTVLAIFLLADGEGGASLGGLAEVHLPSSVCIDLRGMAVPIWVFDRDGGAGDSGPAHRGGAGCDRFDDRHSAGGLIGVFRVGGDRSARLLAIFRLGHGKGVPRGDRMAEVHLPIAVLVNRGLA